jgi:hypothetical protein
MKSAKPVVTGKALMDFTHRTAKPGELASGSGETFLNPRYFV